MNEEQELIWEVSDSLREYLQEQKNSRDGWNSLPLYDKELDDYAKDGVKSIKIFDR